LQYRRQRQRLLQFLSGYKFSDAAGNTNVDGVDTNNSVFLIIDTKVPNAVDLDPAVDIQSTSKADSLPTVSI
jgi:hypothetical protein